MTTTIEPEGDPTFNAFERAKQYGQRTLMPKAAVDQQYNAAQTGNDYAQLQSSQANQIEDSKNSMRSRGFGSTMSGPRAAAEGRIRTDIAQRVNELLLGASQTSTNITEGMLDDLARLGLDGVEEEKAARNRLTVDYAKSGIGI